MGHAADSLTDKRNELEDALKRLGAGDIFVFGSVVRGEDDDRSDIDIAVRLSEPLVGYFYYGALDAMEKKAAEVLGVPVDLVDIDARGADRIVTGATRLSDFCARPSAVKKPAVRT